MDVQYTHTAQLENVSYEHCGKLFGHDLPTAGVVHACNFLDSPRFVGDRYKTLCGKILGSRADIYSAARTVTCRRCRKVNGA